MLSGNNIHVQQNKTNMINEEWNKTQNDAPFVAFYDMRTVTFVLPDEMANVSIGGLQWFILNRNPDNGDFRLFATFCLAPFLFPF